MTNAFDFTPLAARRPAAAGGEIHRPAEIQFHRRQQRLRRAAARRPDRGRRRACSSARAARSRPTGSPAARRATGRCANSWSRKLKRDAGIACTADDILVTSGSLQALDLVNGVLLARGDTVIIEQDCYQGSINRLDPARRQHRSASRSTATACGSTRSPTALDDLKRRGIRPKYIYTIPTVQNPTGTILPEARRAEMLRLAEPHGVPIFEDDCYADLIWDGKRPPALYAMSETRQRHPHRLVLEVDRAGVARRLHRRAVGHAVAHAVDQDRRRLRRARADGAGGILRAAFHRARSGADARPARRSSTR